MTAATAVTGVTSVTAGPRVLAIMGSGETAPAMAKVHRALFERFGARAGGTGGAGPVAAAIIDTPYGFQENADELSARTVEFFATSVGNPVEVASYRSRDVDGLTAATALARIRSARYVMAGPGSPSYALGQWEGGPIPGALAEKLSGGQGGGVLTMASAAALTLGVVTIPVYEIYKVGEAPRWLPGLDLLGVATGLRAAVVPHYDNAEGGSHDTRFCYMGERRLRMLEAMLPDGTFVLGVDSHTALLLDLEAGTATVTGLGGVTVRVDGRSTRFAHGSTIDIEAIGEAARRGLHLPLVYNTNGYDSLDSLKLLDGIVDIYMPDFKFWRRDTSARLVKAEDYPDRAREAILEMHRQVGPLKFGPDGLARRGVLVRHLVMPNHLEETAAIFDWLAREVGNNVVGW